MKRCEIEISRPTKEQVRQWLQDAIKSNAVPSIDSTRSDLNWHSAEPIRKMVLS